MTTGRRLILVRHGRTAWNATGRFQGQADPPLDDLGQRQADLVAGALVHRRPTLLVSSDLRRAVQTAEAIGRRCGLEVHPDRDLREIWLGGWEGLDATGAAASFPEEHRLWVAGEPIGRGGGEIPLDAGRRAARSLRRWLRACPVGGTMVAVVHGLVAQAAVASMRDEGLVRLDGPVPHLRNGAALELAVDFVRARSPAPRRS